MLEENARRSQTDRNCCPETVDVDETGPGIALEKQVRAPGLGVGINAVDVSSSVVGACGVALAKDKGAKDGDGFRIGNGDGERPLAAELPLQHIHLQQNSTNDNSQTQQQQEQLIRLSQFYQLMSTNDESTEEHRNSTQRAFHAASDGVCLISTRRDMELSVALDKSAGGSILLVWAEWNVDDLWDEENPEKAFDHGVKEDFLRRYVDGHVPCIYFVPDEDARVQGPCVVDLAYDRLGL